MLNSLITWIDTNPNWAGWVQAVGSILALIFGFIVVFIQHSLSTRAATEKDRSDDFDAKTALFLVAGELRAKMEKAKDVISRDYDFHAHKSLRLDFTAYAELMPMMPVTRLIMRGHTSYYLRLRRLAEDAAAGFTREPNSLILNVSVSMVAEWLLSCRDIEDELKQALEGNVIIVGRLRQPNIG